MNSPSFASKNLIFLIYLFWCTYTYIYTHAFYSSTEDDIKKMQLIDQYTIISMFHVTEKVIFFNVYASITINYLNVSIVWPVTDGN